MPQFEFYLLQQLGMNITNKILSTDFQVRNKEHKSALIMIIIATKYLPTNIFYVLLNRFYLKFTVSLKITFYYIHFTDEETELHNV